MSEKIRVALFASGSGSNAENLSQYFKNHSQIEVISIYTNNPKAFVIERAQKLGLPYHIFSRPDFYENGNVLHLLATEKIDFIVLAGFLWLVPKILIEAFPNKMINIHPALLPKFGGKGMYGDHVHTAVKLSEEKETGITIHYVNEHYDDGNTIFQARTALSASDTPETIAKKVHLLEYEHFPKVVEQTILKLF